MNRYLRGGLRDRVVVSQLAAVEDLLAERASNSPYRDLHQVHLLSPRSKRLRSLLLLIVGRFGRYPQPEALVRAAAALELVHEGTLYHDDIVDDSECRRGVACAGTVYGAVTAARAGSELFYIAAQLSADLPLPLRRAVGRAAQSVCRGQLAEFELLDNYDVSVQVRARIMMQKTASLFALAAELGTGLSDTQEPVRSRLISFATRFGFAYQLLDDLRDVAASRQELGREPGSDLRDGVPTLPILDALKDGGEAAVPASSIGDALSRLRGSPGLVATAGRLGKIADDLQTILAGCVVEGSEAARRDLATLADMLVSQCPRALQPIPKQFGFGRAGSRLSDIPAGGDWG